MDTVTIEIAEYIIAHYSHLLTMPEKLALKHHRSTLKLEEATNNKMLDLYHKVGWLSDNPNVLNYLSEGYIPFIMKCAEQILQDAPDKVVLNFCPLCGKLARTPHAKQCRHCGHDWH